MAFTEAWLAGPQSTQFYTRKYASTTPKAALVFIHGFAEHVGRYQYPHTKFSERGITVFTFDLRGFGKTAQDVENKSKTSFYGKTCWTDQMLDIRWAIEHVQKDVPGLPVFLMGHSMGGGQVLGFATEQYNETINSLVGVIATGPCIEQTTPASKILRFVGGMLAKIVPYLSVPAEVNPEYLSHDKSVVEAYKNDPLVKATGTLRGLDDMLSKGEELLKTRYKNWSKSLPVLLIHGSDDKVTSYKSTQQFRDKIVADDKEIIIHEGAYHELMNEPDGVKDKVIDQVVEFVEAHIDTSAEPKVASEPNNAPSAEPNDAPSAGPNDANSAGSNDAPSEPTVEALKSHL